MLRINPVQCRELGRVAIQVPTATEHFLPPAPKGVGADTEAIFWMVTTAICQQTRTLQGGVGGRTLRGSDYLIAAMRQHLAQHPQRWTASALGRWTAEELQGAVSDDGDPAGSTLNRLAERLRLLHGVARCVSRRWGGRAMALFETSDRRVTTLLGRLAEMEAYADPVEKKSHLLLLILNERGLWPVADPESLEVAVDYHLMRVALRTGAVEVTDEGLRQRLIRREPADEATDTAVRQAVREACRRMLRETPGLTPFHLDNLLWMVGRNCCFYEHPPVCTRPRACWKHEGCSLIEAFGLQCGLTCPLESMCHGAREPARRALRETFFDTQHY